MSNSVILTNLLSDENNKFASDVQNILDDKLNEFKEIIKKHVSECVTENISNFYNQPNSEFEEEIFTLPSPMSQATIGFWNDKDKYTKTFDQKFCFCVSHYWNGGNHTYYIYPKNDILIKSGAYAPSGHTEYSYDYKTHNISKQAFIISLKIREICKDMACESFISLACLMDNLIKKIHCSNSIEFEKICKTEYSNIKNIKDELQEKQIELNNLIQTQKENEKYYNDLDLKFKEFEKEKQLFEENKKKLLIAKQKINEMEKNLQKEKLLFEKEKQEFYQTSDTINLDDFLISNE